MLVNIGSAKICEINKPKLAGVEIHRNLNFNEDVSASCEKSSVSFLL